MTAFLGSWIRLRSKGGKFILLLNIEILKKHFHTFLASQKGTADVVSSDRVFKVGIPLRETVLAFRRIVRNCAELRGNVRNCAELCGIPGNPSKIHMGWKEIQACCKINNLYVKKRIYSCFLFTETLTFSVLCFLKVTLE